jgi:hypothetical protein
MNYHLFRIGHWTKKSLVSKEGLDTGRASKTRQLSRNYNKSNINISSTNILSNIVKEEVPQEMPPFPLQLHTQVKIVLKVPIKFFINTYFKRDGINSIVKRG